MARRRPETERRNQKFTAPLANAPNRKPLQQFGKFLQMESAIGVIPSICTVVALNLARRVCDRSSIQIFVLFIDNFSAFSLGRCQYLESVDDAISSLLL